MTREWKPGDVALVNDCTNPDAPWEPATCRESAIKGEHEAVWVLHKSGARVWGSVSQARPLVVIDPEDREQVERLAEVWDGLDDATFALGDSPMTVRGYRMQAALREFANPAPPKPEEPGKYGVVIAGDGREWMRYTTSEIAGRDWVRADQSETVYARWDDLDVIRVVREGVTG